MTLEELVKSETARILSQLASTPIAKDTMYTFNKRKRKNHPNRTFISENLTRHRFQLACKLNVNWKHGDINSYWTLEGRIIVKPTEQSHPREQGRIQGGGAHPARAPPKFGKNMNFWRKMVIFHTKYPKNVRASLRSAQFFKVRPP